MCPGFIGSDPLNAYVVSRPAHLSSYAYSSGTGFWVWSSSTTDPRALAPLSGPRVAATAHSTGAFSLTLTATDSAPHTLALYFVDWDTSTRQQTVTIYDAATNEVLDQRTLTSFRGGVYYVYDVQGSIRIQFTRTGGVNAVLSGVFWGN
jgi:hypothetical protein